MTVPKMITVRRDGDNAAGNKNLRSCLKEGPSWVSSLPKLPHNIDVGGISN